MDFEAFSRFISRFSGDNEVSEVTVHFADGVVATFFIDETDDGPRISVVDETPDRKPCSVEFKDQFGHLEEAN